VLKQFEEGETILGFDKVGKVAATTQFDAQGRQTFRIRSLTDGALRYEKRETKPSHFTYGLCPSGEHYTAYCPYGNDTKIRIVPIQDGAEMMRLSTKSTAMHVGCYSPDGRHLVTTAGERIQLWDWRTGERLQTFLTRGMGPGSMAFSSDGRLLVALVVASSPMVNLTRTFLFAWDTKTGERLHRVDCGFGVLGTPALSPDGKLLATSQDGQIQLWNLKELQKIHTFRSHRNGIGALSFSLDGRLLASGSRDQTTLVWDLDALLKP
jgi:WD40 repeat protein